MYQGIAGRRWLATIASVTGLALVTATPGHADPPNDDPAASPYPNNALILTSYTQLAPDEFFADRPGVWFLSPSGLNCGIWDRGNFGCAGDIPGAPPGTNHIGWFNGDEFVHYDWTADIKFAVGGGQAERALPPRSFVIYNGTTCAVMSDNSTYCNRGPYKFLVTPIQTWLNS
jgi:hypothetical protein